MLSSITDLLWKFPVPIIILSLSAYFSLKTGLIQGKILTGIRLSLKTSSKNGTASAFSSLTTTLAATLGTGNIIGLSLAVSLGGPGAVFWCWITGIFGMALSYAETYICVSCKIPGEIGGPMNVLKRRLNKNVVASLYAIGLVVCSLVTSALLQSKALTDAVLSFSDTPPLLVGAITGLTVFLVISEGSQKIHSTCSKLVPLMAAVFLTGILYILIQNHSYISSAILLIIQSAFSPVSLASGIGSYTVSAAIRQGIARGIFTNEAGLGTSAIAATETDNSPHKQALISMSATFWDTVVLCAVTGIALVTYMLSSGNATIAQGGDLINKTFGQLGTIGTLCLNSSIIIFAFATLIGWYHFGNRACLWLGKKKLINAFPYIYSAACIAGSTINIASLFILSDFFSLILLGCNIIVLVSLRSLVVKHTDVTDTE